MQDDIHGLSQSGTDVAEYRTDPQAREIYQDLLDAIDRAFWRRDWAAVMPLIAMPCHLSSPEGRRTVDTPEAFLDLLKAARDNFDVVGATNYHRISRGACFADASRRKITGLHETFILRGTVLIVPRHIGKATMEKEDSAGWRMFDLHTNNREANLPVFSADKVPLSRH